MSCFGGCVERSLYSLLSESKFFDFFFLPFCFIEPFETSAPFTASRSSRSLITDSSIDNLTRSLRAVRKFPLSRYLTCQISAILYADRGDRRKSQSLHRAHLAIFADRGDRRIKSPGVSPALAVHFIRLKFFRSRSAI